MLEIYDMLQNIWDKMISRIFEICVKALTYIYIFQAGLKRVLEIRVRTELGFRAKSLRADYYQRLAQNQPDFFIYRFFRFFIIVTLRIKLQ